MKTLLMDPVVLVCGAIILFGFLGLILAIRSLLRSTPSRPEGHVSDDVAEAVSRLGDQGLDALPISSLGAPREASRAQGVSHEVAERLDSMALRLGEMQAVLQKQSTGATPVPGAPASVSGVGQGFSPETIDKLLKIIGNVIQQVDILQKSLNPSAGNSGAAAEPPMSGLPKV